MRPLRLALANVSALRRRFAGLLLLLVVVGAVCSTAFTLADQAQRAANDRVESSAANRSITIDRLAERPTARSLTDAAIDELSAQPHVVSVEPRTQVSFGYKDRIVPGVLLYATIERPSVSPPITRAVRDRLFPLRLGEAILPAYSQGSDLSSLLGREISIQTVRATGSGVGTSARDTLRVVGLFQPDWQLDGPDAAYIDRATVLRWAAAKAGVPLQGYTATVGFDQLTVLVDSAENVPSVLAHVQKQGFAAASLQQQLATLPGVLSLVRVVGRVLLVVLACVAITGAFVVTGALARQRTREIGVLKAVGFRRNAVLGMLMGEMAILAVVGAATGLLVGVAGATAAAVALRHGSDVAPYLSSGVLLPSAPFAGVLMLLALVVVSLGAAFPAYHAASLAPSDAIREL